jgi:hypothetical protein
MMNLSCAIREKKNWETKLNDPNIVEKWRQEARAMRKEKEFQYVIEELKYYKSLKNGPIEV